MTGGARVSRAAILAQLRLAAKKGDRVALTLATEQMKLWALSPRYWLKYLDLLGHPLARLVDLTVIKQGEKIARQKGWVNGKRGRATPPSPARPTAKQSLRRTVPRMPPVQPALFPDLE